MDALALAAFNLLGKQTGIIPLLLAIVSTCVAIWVYVKNVKINEVTSLGNAQSKNIELLMKQVELLSEQLSKATKELEVIRLQNAQLSLRIVELEATIRRHGLPTAD